MGKKIKTKKQPIWIIILILLFTLAFLISRTLRSIGYKTKSDRVSISDIKESEKTKSSDNTRIFHIENQDILITMSTEKTDNPYSKNKNYLEMLVPPEKPQKGMLLGKAQPSQRDLLMVSVAPGFANRDGLLMHRDAYNAFLKMHQAAQQDGISLTIISAYRSFDHQKRIWENKWNGQQVLSGNIRATDIADPEERASEILRFSAMPGTSRHHWGTDIDINSLNNSYFLSGRGKKEYDWLKENAHKYGFCQPYTQRSDRNNTGYEEEKWHWSYLPVASVYLETFKDSVQYQHIKGFDGWQTAEPLQVIENYVMGINKDCY